jgi:hypothetical protein
VVIVQHFADSVNQYIAAFPSPGYTFKLPDQCPHPECRSSGYLICWGSYKRGALTTKSDSCIRVQRIRCKVCGRTHSLLPDFLHPYRHFVISLLHLVVSLYLIRGLGWGRLMAQVEEMKDLPERGPARSTVREWVRSFAFGTGELLLDLLTRQLMTLDPLAELPRVDTPPPAHWDDILNPTTQRRLARAHRFWCLAEHLYALAKGRKSDLHFAAAQFFPFLLHWLQTQAVPPRLFWSPVLATTPVTSF